MSANPIDHLFTLQRTPFALAPVIHQLYEYSETRERDILLSYLVLPLVMYPPMREYLLKVQSRSSLRTMCNEQKRLVGLATRVEDFKLLTNAAMLILAAEKGIEITENLSVKSVGSVKIANTSEELLKAGRKLAIIFSGIDVVSIYRTLGLKSL